MAEWKSIHDCALVHAAYENYVIQEDIPFIKHLTGWFDPMMTTGCSMGAYHALNIFLQHPDVFNKVIALSGIYDARFFNQQADYGQDDLVFQIPAWFDEWGGDVAHDWEWWRRQMPYFLQHIL
ncbi:Uncharacterized protein conserved in bacteria [Chlamydia trachomatis]|nr:Uncharacterized protein conserved in bacteria [Chlamydia trachomatis]